MLRPKGGTAGGHQDTQLGAWVEDVTSHRPSLLVVFTKSQPVVGTQSGWRLLEILETSRNAQNGWDWGNIYFVHFLSGCLGFQMFEY